MKIAIGYTLQEGPYGGGNSLVLSFREWFTAAGHEVVFDLTADDVDIILLTDPRSRSPNISFAAGAALRYLSFRNPHAVVVQLIQDCDERKNTRNMNRRQRIANYAADHAVAVGTWMLDLDLVRQENRQRFTVILNGGRPAFFHPRGHQDWDGEQPMKLITHHWGGHWMKGFDVYQRLDEMLADPAWSERIEFTYIGNVPAGFQFQNSRHLPPMSGEALADELRAHHVYITASLNEPAGLHHIEGAMCGLPIIYRNSGGLPEYCEGYGMIFEGPDDVADVLSGMMREYPTWRASLGEYPHTETRMVGQWLALFEDLIERRDDIRRQRRLWRNPLLWALNQIPF